LSNIRYLLLISEEGFIWLLLNIVIPLVPVIFFVVYATTFKTSKFEESVLIPSLFLFAFALLVTGFYVLLPIASARRSWSRGILAWAALLGLILCLLFSYYHATVETKEWINANLICWRILFIVSVFTIIGLNYPVIRNRIGDRKEREPYKEAKSVGESVHASRPEIEGTVAEADNEDV